MSQEIAQTIRQQIGRLTLMRIAAHDFAYIPEKEKEHLGGLTFKIGANPKIRGGGRVTILLDFNDTYSVKIFNNRGRELYSQSDAYCANLGGRNGVIESQTG